MPDAAESQHGGAQVLLSRRQILTGTTYAVGATLLFHQITRSRLDPDGPPHPIDPTQPQPRPAHPLPATRRTAQTDDPRRGGDAGGPAAPAPDVESAPRRAVHRAKLAAEGRPRSVCKADAGVLVVGVSADGEPLGWLTTDGTRWVEHTLAAPERQVIDVWGVTGYDGYFVAVGATTERRVRRIAESGIVRGRGTQVTYTHQRRSPTVWWTTDGERWSGQTLEAVVDAPARLIAIDSHGDQLVAVGSTLDSDGVQNAGGLILTSTGGASWRRADLGDEDGPDGASFTGVTVDAGGRWYATSVDIRGGAVWTSGDGRHWSVVPGSRRAFRGTAIQGIGSDGGRLLVAGTSVLEPQPRYYVSRSGGRRWRSAALDVSMLTGPDALVGDLSVIDGDVVVVGTYRDAPVLEGGQLHAAN